ncbi:MAG: 50S ribosomal protein L9 [Mycoplasmataceae bacterium]|jgi:large subunit ribosomal protein L9|nr:50S ribosomal protein L9 [Mycoplasmataceae bacterium]
MRVILLQDIKNLGKKNTIVEVKDGYGINYLIKNKLAVQATDNSMLKLDETLKELNEIDQQKRSEATKLKEQIEKINLSFSLKTNRGNVFGSISTKEIIETLKQKHNIVIDKYMIQHDEKKLLLGVHFLQLHLYKDVIAKLKININEEK